MSKQVRTLIIVLAVIAVLGGSLAALLLIPRAGEDSSSGASATASSDPGISLIDKSKDADGKSVEHPVKKAVLKTGDREEEKDEDGEITTPAYAGEEFSLILNDEEDLVIDLYADLSVGASSAVNTLSSNLAAITASKKIADDPEDPSIYGFDTPRAVVTVTYHDDTTYSFELGDETPLKEGYYFREQGKSTVYMVSTSFGNTVSQGSLNYVGTTLYSAPSVESDDDSGQAILRDMKLSGRSYAQSFAFRATTTDDGSDVSFSPFVLTSPYRRMTDSNVMESYAALTSLSASKAVVVNPTAEQLKTYGFDDPFSVAELNLAVKTTEKVKDEDDKEVDKTKYYNVRPHTVTLGNKNNDGNYYCMVDDVPVVYLVSASSVPWATLQYDDAAGNQLFMKDITTVDKVIVKANGAETVFQLEHFPDADSNDDKMKVTVGDKTYSTPNFRTLYQWLMTIKRLGPVETDSAGDPILEVELVPVDERDAGISAKIYYATASSYNCVMGSGESYRVSADSVDRAVAQLEKYLAGEDLEKIY